MKVDKSLPMSFLPTSFNGDLDQGYVQIAPGSGAQYSDLEGTFSQFVAIPEKPNRLSWLPSRYLGRTDPDYTRATMKQVFDLRTQASSIVIPVVSDPGSSDIQMYRVRIFDIYPPNINTVHFVI